MLLQIQIPSEEQMKKMRLHFRDLATADKIAYLLGSEWQLTCEFFEAIHQNKSVNPYLLDMLIHFDDAIDELAVELQMKIVCQDCQRWHCVCQHTS